MKKETCNRDLDNRPRLTPSVAGECGTSSGYASRSDDIGMNHLQQYMSKCHRDTDFSIESDLLTYVCCYYLI